MWRQRIKSSEELLMAEKPIDYRKLLELVNRVMEICVQETARSEGLEALLIDKGIVTKAELTAKIQECAEKTKKLANSLGQSSGNES